MDIMIDSTKYCVWAGKLMSCDRIFVPCSLKAIDRVEKLWIVDVDFMRTNSYDWAYEIIRSRLGLRAGNAKAYHISCAIS